MKRILGVTLVLCMVMGVVSASALTASGTVTPGKTVTVAAPIGGTVDAVNVEKGMVVAAGDVMATLKTTKIYAPEDGTVTGVFAKAGDDAEKVTERYGADLYIEGALRYTVSASTSKAYSSVGTTFVHAGEPVYLLCRENATRKGAGIIAAVEGTDYTVLVTEGEFIPGDTVSVFRDSSYAENQRVGRGNVARVSPTAVNGTGAVARVAVADGQQVKRGDLLMETLDGTFDGYEMTGTDVTAVEEGVITSVSVEPGQAVTKGDVVAQIAPVSGMRVEAAVSADDRKSLKAGDKVTLELEADESRAYEGTVRYLTEIPEEETEEVTYKAIIDFTPDEHVVFGMTVVVTAGENHDTMDAGE